MNRDPLYEPLGLAPLKAGRPSSVAVRLSLMLAVVLAIAIGAATLMRTVHGGDDGSVAVATIAPPAKPEPHAAAASPETSTASVAAAQAPEGSLPGGAASSTGPGSVVTQPNGDTVEVQNGVKIIRLGAASRSGLIAVPPPPPPTFATTPAAASAPAGPDPGLLDPSRYGPLPHISAAGLRPSEAYAAHVSGMAPGAPRLALLVDGLGADALATQAAARRLPAAVSLAFSPSGTELASQVAQARDAGHELLLQLPTVLEGKADPAPSSHGFTAAAGSGNLETLHWAMGRFGGYAGLASMRGTAFLASPAAVPVLRDIAARGLFLVMDTPGGAVDTLAATVGLGTAAADVSIDGSADGPALKAALSHLADLARRNGRALGYIRTLPADLGPILAFTQDLAGQGIALVPVSALAGGAATRAADTR